MNYDEIPVPFLIETKFETFKLVIETILKRATAYEWSLQGFGMLRLYLNRAIRLSVWDSRYIIPNVSIVHDHPWDFDSLVITGAMTSRIYKVLPDKCPQPNFMFSTIQCGAGACVKTEPKPVYLIEEDSLVTKPGCVYHQRFDTIHSSHFAEGTVTLCKRTFHEDTEHARSFWPIGTEWVSAAPRTATDQEVLDITQNALRQWVL